MVFLLPLYRLAGAGGDAGVPADWNTAAVIGLSVCREAVDCGKTEACRITFGCNDRQKGCVYSQPPEHLLFRWLPS